MKVSKAFTPVIQNTTLCKIIDSRPINGKDCLAVKTDDVNRFFAAFFLRVNEIANGDYRTDHNLKFYLRILLDNAQISEIEETPKKIQAKIVFPAFRKVTYAD